MADLLEIGIEVQEALEFGVVVGVTKSLKGTRFGLRTRC